MSREICTHKTAAAHKLGRYWICSGCGRKFRWNNGSGYFGNMECLKCGLVNIQKVFCSAQCRSEAGDPKSWRKDEGREGLGEAAAGEGAPCVALAHAGKGGAPESARTAEAPRSASVVLTEQDLTEIMVALVEAAKDKLCSAERAARIQALLDGKIDPAMREVRL